MSIEYTVGPITRAEKAEEEVVKLQARIVEVETDRNRYLEERNQLLEHLANEVDAA